MQSELYLGLRIASLYHSLNSYRMPAPPYRCPGAAENTVKQLNANEKSVKLIGVPLVHVKGFRTFVSMKQMITDISEVVKA